MFGSFATGESADGCWTFKRVGFIRTKVTIRACDGENDIAVFRNATWTDGGTLELPNGREIRASTNFWQTKLEFQTSQNELLLTLEPRGVIHLGARLVIEARAATMPELPWMAMLGFYLVLMMQDEVATVAAAAT